MTASRLWTAGAVAATVVMAALAAPRVQSAGEVRARWISHENLTSPQAIDDIAASARQAGIDTLLVQARAAGDAYFLNGVEMRPASLLAQPAFDPLAEAIARGHARGLAVYAWINVNLISGTDVPVARTHIVYRHPEWLMVPRQIADEVARLDPAGPEYLGRLMRYARWPGAGVEGLYLSPASAGALEYTISIVRDIVQRYAVDGVHFDYLRYPSDDFDYGRETLRAFGQNPAQVPDRWRQFRVDRLTKLLSELRKTVKSARPSAAVSVAIEQDPAVASVRHFQDLSGWLSQGLIDVVCRQSPAVILPVSQLGQTAFSAPF